MVKPELKPVVAVPLVLELLLWIIAHPAMAQERGLIAVDPPLAPGSSSVLPVPLGTGWNFIANTTKAIKCVTGVPSPTVPRTTFETAGQYTDGSTLADSLKISAHAQASFLIASAEAETSYVLKHKANVTGNYIAVYAGIRDLNTLVPAGGSASAALTAVRALKESAKKSTDPSAPNQPLFGTFSLSPASVFDLAAEGIALTEDSLTLLKTEGIAAFEAKCGQGYVQASETGADLVGFYKFNTSTTDVQSQMMGSLKGNYLGQSLSGSVDNLVQSLNSSSAQLIDYNQFGGSPTHLPMSKAGFLKAVENFTKTLPPVPSDQRSTAKTFKIYVATYGPDTVSNWPTGLPPSSKTATTPLDKLVEQYWLLDAVYEQLASVIANPNDYILNWGTTLNDVKNQQSELLRLEREQQDSIKKCYIGEGCAAPPLASTEAYYVHISRLPLPISTSSAFKDLLAAARITTNMVYLYNRGHHNLIAASQASDEYRPGNDSTCYKRNQLNHQVMVPSYQKNVKPVLDDLRARDKNLPDQLPHILRTTSFETINRVRCGIGRSAFGCASARELDAWVKHMKVSAPHGVSINDQDDKVYGDCPAHDLSLVYKVD